MLADIYEFFTGATIDFSTLDSNLVLIVSVGFVVLCIVAITKVVKFFFALPGRFT